MVCYSVQPRDQKFVKSNGFQSFANSMSRNIGKNKILVKIYAKTQTVNTAKNNLIMVNNLRNMHLKLLSKE